MIQGKIGTGFLWLFSFLLSLLFYLYKFNSIYHGVGLTSVLRVYHTSTSEENRELNTNYLVADFKSNYNNLGTVSVKITNITKTADSSGNLVFILKDMETNEELYQGKYMIDKIQGYLYFPFGFPVINNSNGCNYRFEILLEGKDTMSINTKSDYFLTKHDFPKKTLLSNKLLGIKVIFYKISSLFLNLRPLVYLFVFFQSFILFFLLRFFPLIMKKILFFIKIIFTKDYLSRIIFLLVSFVIFYILIQKPQSIRWDAIGYLDLAKDIYVNNYNVVGIDFGNRTFGFPFYLSLLIGLSNLLNIKVELLIYIFNYLLFCLSTFAVAFVIRKYNKKTESVFLILSAFNLINLSFTHTILTESFTVFLVCYLFYFFNKKNLDRCDLFYIGFFSSLSVIVRPSNLFLFLIIFFWIIFLFKKRLYLLFYFLIPAIVLFFISIINTYNIENRISIFTTKTQGIYDMQVREGIYDFKYETSVDIKYINAAVHFRNNLFSSSLPEITDCKNSFECIYKYLTKDFLSYITISLIHLYSMFDRNYINLYVENVDKIDALLMFYNYFILSAFICMLVFFIDKKTIIKYKKIINSFLILVLGTLLIYIPTVVEPRFSSSVYILFIMCASFVPVLYILDFLRKLITVFIGTVLFRA